MLAVKIPVRNLEETRQIVLKNKILNKDGKIKVENGRYFFDVFNIIIHEFMQKCIRKKRTKK